MKFYLRAPMVLEVHWHVMHAYQVHAFCFSLYTETYFISRDSRLPKLTEKLK